MIPTSARLPVNKRSEDDALGKVLKEIAALIGNHARVRAEATFSALREAIDIESDLGGAKACGREDSNE